MLSKGSPLSRKMQLPKIPEKEKESSWQKFKNWLKDTKLISGSLGHLSRLDILNKYKDAILALQSGSQALGYGKRKIKSAKRFVTTIHQYGVILSRGLKIAHQMSPMSLKQLVELLILLEKRFEKGIKPAWNYAKSKPISSLGALLKDYLISQLHLAQLYRLPDQH
mgnify:CR=1 FL=1